jgi:hypothetical protein
MSSEKNLENRIENIEKNIELINKKLDRLLELYEKDCKKMSNHIDFVENVYDKVRAPFNFVMDTIQRTQLTLTPNSTREMLEYEKET